MVTSLEEGERLIQTTLRCWQKTDKLHIGAKGHHKARRWKTPIQKEKAIVASSGIQCPIIGHETVIDIVCIVGQLLTTLNKLFMQVITVKIRIYGNVICRYSTGESVNIYVLCVSVCDSVWVSAYFLV